MHTRAWLTAATPVENHYCSCKLFGVSHCERPRPCGSARMPGARGGIDSTRSSAAQGAAAGGGSAGGGGWGWRELDEPLTAAIPMDNPCCSCKGLVLTVLWTRSHGSGKPESDPPYRLQQQQHREQRHGLSGKKGSEITHNRKAVSMSRSPAAVVAVGDEEPGLAGHTTNADCPQHQWPANHLSLWEFARGLWTRRSGRRRRRCPPTPRGMTRMRSMKTSWCRAAAPTPR